ncbi:MAG: hypothetical protein Fur0046_14120 [Cyanobacteria bacterium J069]
MLRVSVSLGIACVGVGTLRPGNALPPPEDVPEEVLRTQIVLEGRSPATGQPLTASQQAVQQRDRQTALDQPRDLPPQVQQIVILLKLRRLLRPVLPFIP